MDDELEPSFLDVEVELPVAAPPRKPERAPRALVVEDDPELSRVCSHALSRLGMRPEVVWTRDAALEVLAAGGEPLAFAFVDARVLGESCDAAAAELRHLRPATPFAVASRSMCDLLAADNVAICAPFTADEFEAAFDAALLFDEEERRRFHEAADAVKAIDAAAPQETLAPAGA